MLTPHFSLNELTASATALRFNINNTPSEAEIKNLEHLCQRVLEPLRKAFGPIYINSGYRCEQLNALVGGVGNSQHLWGEAADIRLPNTAMGREYYRFILQRGEYDQLLFEHSRYGRQWLHVSLCRESERNRHMAFANYRV